MKKITDFIVEKRNIFLVLFIILAGISLVLATKVNINEDIMEYLPETSETKIGNDIMTKEFAKQDTSYLNVMFKDLTNEEKEDTLNKLKNIDGVESVDYENTSKYNIDNYTLYVLNVDDYSDSKTATEVYKAIENNFDIVGMSGSISDENEPVLDNTIVIVAITCAVIILIILSESYIEPFLYLIAIGLAVFINKGTNIMFDSVSTITDSITAILQLALSMDYSIMLSNRYKQEKEKTSDKIKAMKEALYDSFKSISSSSITTIVGLLALVFMSFTIGRDLGFVLAKGVLLSLICIFFCLPALLLLFEKLILKTHKKTPHFDLTKLGKFSYKSRWLQTIAIIVLFVVAYFLQGNTNILYTNSEEDEVGKIFSAANQIAIVYENKYEDIIANYCKKLEEDKKIDDVLCYSNTINESLEYDKLNAKFDSLGQDTTIEEDLIKIIYYNYFNKDEVSSLSINDFITFIKDEVYDNEKFSDSLSDDVKENLDLLANFATPQMINKKRNIYEIASILDMNKSDAKNILVYYNSKKLNTEMTISDFVNFMLNDVANDKDYASNLDSDTIYELEKLQKFTNINTINKEMNSKELADIFGIEENLIDQLLLFNRIKSDSKTKITLNEFTKTALRLASDKDYEDVFDDDTISSLKLLQSLSDESVVSKNRDILDMSTTLANFGFSLSKDKLNLLYTLYDGYNTNTKMTINTFATEALDYKDMFDDDTISSLNFLQSLSDESVVSKDRDILDMNTILANFKFNLGSDKLKLLYTLYNGYNNTKMDLYSFVKALELAKNSDYGSYFEGLNEEDIPALEYIVQVNEASMTHKDLYNFFNITYNEELENELKNYNINYEDNLTPIEFVNILLNYNDIGNYLDSKDIANLKQVQIIMAKKFSASELAEYLEQNPLVISMIYGVASGNPYNGISIQNLMKFIDDNKKNPLLAKDLEIDDKLLRLAHLVTSNVKTEYSSSELSELLSQDRLIVSFIYGVSNSSIDEISVKNLISFIYKNKDNSLLAKNLGNNTESLDLAYLVTSNTRTKYNYSQISKITETDKDKAKQIYGLYDYLNFENLLSPFELTNLILDNLEDELLKDKLDASSLEKLDLVKKVMVNTLNNTKVSSSYISDLFDIEKDTTSLLFGLYDFKYIKSSQNISLYNYINFIISDVMNNKDFSSKFDKDTRDKLTTINSIMTKALNNQKYNSLELYGTLRVLNKDLNKSLVELVYLYNSSINEYNQLWKMTIEEFINYLNSDILNDSKFNDFIDEEMSNKITDAKDTIDKSKDLIVSDKYSRVILNTKYPFEDEETFNFINNLKKDIGNKDGIYIVGNSPMAVEMGETFGDELNKITILTMIFIFVVVAITFKDLLIPLILILIIQCAVYITMSFISISGGSVYFISLLIVQAILMGATIDYAIVYTSYYKESRLTMSVKDSIINSYNKSIHTIITSSSILIIVTIIVANFASAIAAKICETISQGAFASAILILLILPGVLASVDRIICRENYKKNRT